MIMSMNEYFPYNKNTKMYVNGVTFYLISRMLFEGVSSSPMVSDES